jgi:hypothetical protein
MWEESDDNAMERELEADLATSERRAEFWRDVDTAERRAARARSVAEHLRDYTHIRVLCAQSYAQRFKN